MGVTLYNKKDLNNLNKVVKKNNELLSLYEKLHIDINHEDFWDLEKSTFFEILSRNTCSIGYSSWNNFLVKYIWSFFDEQGISTINFNSDENGTISSKEMKLLLRHLNSQKNVNETVKIVIEFLNKNKNGITYS